MTLQLVTLYLLGINIITLAAYGIDKWKARHHQWRISEVVLLFLAFIGGAMGAFLGMRLFHHKTQHWKFRILVPLLLILQIAVLVYCRS